MKITGGAYIGLKEELLAFPFVTQGEVIFSLLRILKLALSSLNRQGIDKVGHEFNIRFFVFP
jgi:hypothetical protein